MEWLLIFFVVISSLIMGDELGIEVAVSVKSASVEAVLKGQMKKISMYLGEKLSCTQTNVHWNTWANCHCFSVFCSR